MSNRPEIPEGITHIEYFDQLLRDRVNKSAIPRIAGVDVVIQFEITDKEDGVWSIVIEKGIVKEVTKGVHNSPTSVFSLGSEVFLSILLRKITLQQAFFSGKMDTKGDVLLALKLNALFDL